MFLPGFSEAVGALPGMITLQSGATLYWLAYASTLDGDVIELGSWQGRSTSFLAAACRDSSNGRVHAIDHFLGNPGKQEFFVVGREDLSDLRENLDKNLRSLNLTDWVSVHEGSSSQVLPAVRAECDSARMLFIDAQHTFEAVTEDLSLYEPLLCRGGILVFDDYSPAYPGVVQAVKSFLTANGSEYCKPVQAADMLIVRKRL